MNSKLLFLLLAIGLWQGCSRESASPSAVYSVVFHEVSPTNLQGPCVSPDYFQDVLRMIQIGGKTSVLASDIALSVVEKRSLPDNAVALTFDDGWPGVCDYADPLLEKYHMQAVLFAATDCIDQGRPRYCSWDDLKKMHDSGRWEIHSHSVSHSDFLKLDDESLHKEMALSLERLCEHGFVHANLISYPFGHCDARVKNMARRCEYLAGFIAGGSARIETNSDLYELPRTTICQLFKQELVCRKLGLECKTIRRDLAIYDEGEGKWDSRWTQVKPDPGVPRGLYRDSYIRSSTQGAQWSIEIPIANEGVFEFSVWNPAVVEEGDITNSLAGKWKISTKDGQILQENIIENCKKNGWTALSRLNCKPNTYVITLTATLDSCNTFIVDALKAERISN